MTGNRNKMCEIIDNLHKYKITKSTLKVRDEDEGDGGANASVGFAHPHVRTHPR